MIRLAHRGDGERVRGGAIEDKEHLGRALEHLADQVAGPGRPEVVAVASNAAGVCGGESLPSLGTHSCRVVAGELAAGGRTRGFSGDGRSGWCGVSHEITRTVVWPALPAYGKRAFTATAAAADRNG